MLLDKPKVDETRGVQAMSVSNRTLIVSTCGTSILTAGSDAAMRDLLNRHANAHGPDAVPDPERREILARIEACRNALVDASTIEHLRRASAELNGIARYYQDRLSGQDHHILIATDTWLGEVTASIISEVLQRHGHAVEVNRVADLRTDDIAAFRAALAGIARWSAETLSGYRDAGYHIVFNLTGGFKAVQGFMQTLGMLAADECVYVFERSDELMRLPRLPIRMQAEDYVRDHLGSFRRMAIGLPVDEQTLAGVPEPLLFIVDGKASLSEWGELVWHQLKPDVYGERLWDVPSDRVAFGPRMRKSVEGLSADRLRLVNQRLDDLARYLETGGAYLQSLDFKPLKGKPVDGSTHEMDAWADGDAKRLFGHFEASVFVVDRLDDALH
jgi:putative CRISPR-associated protein (TIGR02619 family)